MVVLVVVVVRRDGDNFFTGAGDGKGGDVPGLCVLFGDPYDIPSRWLMLLRDGSFDGKDRAARSSVMAGAVGKEVESLIVLLVIGLLKITASN